MKKKTYKSWEKSEVDLDKYLDEPCEIDEALDLYIGECVAPKYLSYGLTQGGDCVFEDDLNTRYYMTTSVVNGKHFYLGVLPEFKQ